MVKSISGRRGLTFIICLVCIVAACIFVFVTRDTDGSKSSGQTENTRSTKAAQNTNSQRANEEIPTNQSTPNSSNGNQITVKGYLVIKEWGVQVEIPSALRSDITYFKNERAYKDFGGPILMDFLSKKFSAGQLKCSYIEGDLPRSLVSIEEINLGDSQPSDYTPAPFKVIGPKAYRFVKTPCEEVILREGSTEDKQLLDEIKQAVSTTLQAGAEGAGN